MSETKHTTTFEARDEASDVIERIGAAAGKAGVKLTAAAGIIEETAKGCGVLGDDAARVSTMVAGAGDAAGKYAETLAGASKNSKTLASETYAVGAAARKAAEDTETFGGKLRSHAGFAADAMVALRGFAA